LTDQHSDVGLALSWLCRQVSAEGVRKVTRLHGGTATEVYGVLFHGSPTRRAVLKLYSSEELLRQEPDAPRLEATALGWVADLGLPVPRLLAADSSGAASGIPAIATDWLDGTVELPSLPTTEWLEALAAPLAAVHAHPAPGDDRLPDYEPWVDWAALGRPPWTRVPRAWDRAIERLLAGPPPARSALLHRDYHPTNVLWSAGRVSALLDWANACVGPPQVDYAHCRLNLVHLWGPAAAETFLAAAKDLARTDTTTWWDLACLAEWLPGPQAYAGWDALGVDWLSAELIRDRLDEYVEMLVR
jgi:aminoglycoside phosphotransferase (APT) family kinase protein